jgi:hypothetical protein
MRRALTRAMFRGLYALEGLGRPARLGEWAPSGPTARGLLLRGMVRQTNDRTLVEFVEGARAGALVAVRGPNACDYELTPHGIEYLAATRNIRKMLDDPPPRKEDDGA